MRCAKHQSACIEGAAGNGKLILIRISEKEGPE
jgi:hypothetical protein